MLFLRNHIHTSLLDALVIFSKLYGKEYSSEVLISGLPMKEGDSVPKLFDINNQEDATMLFSRSAYKAGYKTKLVNIDIDDISGLTLPCILLLKTKVSDEVNACILESFDETRELANIIFPEIGEVPSQIHVDDLIEEYYGLALFLKKELRFDSEDFKLIDNKKQHWFWDTLKDISHIYKDVLISSFVISLFMLATPMFTMNIYDRVVPNLAFDTLWVFVVGITLIYIVDFWLKSIRVDQLEVAAKKADIVMSSILYEKILDTKMSNISRPIGAFAESFKSFEAIRNFFASSTITMVIDLPFVILYLATIFYIAGNLVFVTMFSMLIILLYTLSIRSKMLQNIKAGFAAGKLKNGVLFESIHKIYAIKSLNAMSHFQYKWEETTGEIAERAIITKKLSSTIANLSGFIAQFNTVLLITVGVYMIADQELTVGALIATVIMSGRALAPMGQVAGMIAYYQRIVNSYRVLEKLMASESEHPAGKEYVRRTEFNGEIEFKNVTFSYPHTEQTQLIDINFKIKKGEKVAIIGKTGSGKTTLHKLILGFYQQEEGSILLDGVDVRQIDPTEIRGNISYLSQECTLFEGTARSNIAFKNQRSSDPDIVDAAKLSGADEFINRHPKGYDLPVFDTAENLSGGQAQSLALARTLIDKSNFFILDEPMQSLDTQSVKKIIKNLKEFFQDKTLLLITHSPADLELVDRIIVMDSGKIIADGKKSEVLKQLGMK